MALLAIVTSEPCGHCKTFKAQHLDKLLRNLNDIPGLVILHANFPSMRTEGFPTSPNGSYNKNIFKFFNTKNIKVPMTVNPKLETLIKGFPQFFMFSLANWNSNDELKGILFNGTITDKEKPLPRTAEGITEWVKKNLPIVLNEITSTITPSVRINDQNERPGYIEPTRIRIKVSPQLDD